VVLFEKLSSQDMIEIPSKLSKMGEQYKLDLSNPEGGIIRVKKSDVDRLTSNLVQLGYPSVNGLINNDIYMANVGMFTTDADKKAYKQMQLEDRIIKTIRMFDNVKDAVVNIDLGVENKYVLGKMEQPATAAVVVYMNEGYHLKQSQVDGIVTLVSKSVSGMQPHDVSIHDGNGNRLTSYTDDPSEMMNNLKESLAEYYRQTVKSDVLQMVGNLFGYDNVKVGVSCEVDVSKIITEILEYVKNTEEGYTDWYTWRIEYENGEGGVGGYVGTETNAEIPLYPGYDYNGNADYFLAEMERKYALGYIKKQISEDAGRVTDMRVNLTIDGNPEDYSEATRTEIITLAGNNVYIDRADLDEKVSLMIYPFPKKTIVDPEPVPTIWDTFPIDVPVWMQSWQMLTALAIAALLKLLSIYAVQRKIRKAFLRKRLAKIAAREATEAASAKAVEDAARLAEAQAERERLEVLDLNAQNMLRTRENELKSKIGDFTDTNPEISAQLIKTWLRGDEASWQKTTS
jgi:flagellar M-ring protein FliF